MKKHKKYPKLPNGYGSIKYLGKNRRNPYAVHPPAVRSQQTGDLITPKALCYVRDWMTGFAVLTAYKAGIYYPGMEKKFSDLFTSSDTDITQRILADYNLTKAADERLKERKKTFREVYMEFYHWKYEADRGQTYSKSSVYATRAAFKHCAALYEKPFADIRHWDLQQTIDRCRLKHASKELILTLFHQIYAYGEIYELCEKDYSVHVRIHTPEDDVSGVPFSEPELGRLWKHAENPVVEMILIMCYSGYRIAAYQGLEVNIAEQYFCGGVKTTAGKGRVVPIHSAICPFVRRRIEREGCIMPDSTQTFRKKMYRTLEELGVKRHTPHDCRHTFSALCEQYGVNENDRRRMLGHSFGADVTNSVYGHRTLEDLREQIEKIKICY